MHPTQFKEEVKGHKVKIDLETAALDHACNVVRRQVQGELKDLTLFFIAHEPGERLHALEAKKNELYEHPGGENLYSLLHEHTEEKIDNSIFVGFASAKEKRFFSFSTHNKTIAAFYMNTAEYRNDEEIRQSIYHLTWHALNLLDHYKNKDIEFYREENGAVSPAYDLVKLARENMLADAFSTIMLELQGHRKFIRKLAIKRCEMALQPITGYHAEQYPYPIAADATQLVYDELVDNGINAKTKNINYAVDITREIGFTYDDNSIRQWTAFSTASQEMAWLGFDKNKILSTALYTSEDPYVRSTAYIVVESLHMEPAALTALNHYNPFTDQEVNERLHKRLCDDIFQYIISKATKPENANLFFNAAVKQNTLLLNGTVTGWGAHALMAAQNAFTQAFKDDSNPNKHATVAYQNARKAVPWENMLALSRIIMDEKREGTEITTKFLIELCSQNADFSPISSALQWAPPPEQEKKKPPADNN